MSKTPRSPKSPDFGATLFTTNTASALITDAQFTQLDMMLRTNMPIDKILDFTDKILITETTINIQELRSIRMRLDNRRIKK